MYENNIVVNYLCGKQTVANCEGSGFDVGVSRTVFVYVRQRRRRRRRRNVPVFPFAFLGRPSFGNRHFVKHLVNHRPVPRTVNHCDISTEKAVSLFFAFCFCLLVFNRRWPRRKSLIYLLRVNGKVWRTQMARNVNWNSIFLVIVSFIIQTNYAIF